MVFFILKLITGPTSVGESMSACAVAAKRPKNIEDLDILVKQFTVFSTSTIGGLSNST